MVSLSHSFLVASAKVSKQSSASVTDGKELHNIVAVLGSVLAVLIAWYDWFLNHYNAVQYKQNVQRLMHHHSPGSAYLIVVLLCQEPVFAGVDLPDIAVQVMQF